MGGAARIEMRDRVGVHACIRRVAAGPLPPLTPFAPRVRGCVRARDPSSEFDSWMRLVISESSCVTYSRVACVCVRSCARAAAEVHSRTRSHRRRWGGRVTALSSFSTQGGNAERGEGTLSDSSTLATFYNRYVCVYVTLCTWHGSRFCDSCERQDIPCNAIEGSRVFLRLLFKNGVSFLGRGGSYVGNTSHACPRMKFVYLLLSGSYGRECSGILWIKKRENKTSDNMRK